MRRIRTGMAIGLLGLGLVPVAKANDLLETYRAAIDRDATLQAAYAQRRASVESRPQALAAFLPQLDASAGIVRERQVIGATDTVITTPGEAAADTGEGRFFGTTRNYGLTLNQAIWSFEAFHRLRESSAQVAQAEATFRSAQQGLILRVAQAYFAVLAAGDAWRTNQLARNAFGELLREAQHRVDTGIAPRTDVQEAQAFYDVTAAGVIDAESQLEDAKRALVELTASYPKRLQALREEIPLIAPTPAQPDDWVASAKDGNFDLSSLQFQAEAAHREVSVQRAKRYPTLGLQGVVTKSDADADFGGDQRLDSAGLVVSWPLLRGGATQSMIRQAQATADQLDAQTEASRRAIERQTRSAYRGVVSGIAKIKAAQQAVVSNKQAMSASQIGVEVGTRSEFDLLNAQNNYYSALQTYHQSRYDYLTSVLTLKQLAGRLTEADLGAIDAMLEPGSDASAPPTEDTVSSPFKKMAAKRPAPGCSRASAASATVSADSGRNSLRLRVKIVK